MLYGLADRVSSFGFRSPTFGSSLLTRNAILETQNSKLETLVRIPEFQERNFV
jgi:hypothetical protein